MAGAIIQETAGRHKGKVQNSLSFKERAGVRMGLI
jgi:hypothetical protein